MFVLNLYSSMPTMRSVVFDLSRLPGVGIKYTSVTVLSDFNSKRAPFAQARLVP